MKQPRLQVAKFIADATLADGSNRRLSQQIAAYLITERRVSELSSLLRDVQYDWQQAGYLEVMAASAHPLSESSLKRLKQSIGKHFPAVKTINLTEVHDPTILGGVRLSLARQQLDLSVQAKLNTLKQLTIAGKA